MNVLTVLGKRNSPAQGKKPQRGYEQVHAGEHGTRVYLIVTSLLNQAWHKHHSLILRQLIALQTGICNEQGCQASLMHENTGALHCNAHLLTYYVLLDCHRWNTRMSSNSHCLQLT